MKKILSVLLTLVMLFGVFAIVASAENTTIDFAEIEFDTDITGVNASDYEEYIYILTEGLEFEDNYGDPGVYVYDSNGDYFEDEFLSGETYGVSVFLSATAGYELGDVDTAYVNGLEYEAYVGYWYPDEDADPVYYITIDIEFTVGEELVNDVNPGAIDYADITIDSDIAGLGVDDYEDYIYIFTEGLEFEDNYGDPAVYVCDSNGDEFYGDFVAGETYTFYVYLSPMEDYYFADEVTGVVNGEEVYSYVDCWYPDDVQVDYVCLEYDLTVTEAVEELSFFARIIQLIINLIAFLFGI